MWLKHEVRAEEGGGEGGGGGGEGGDPKPDPVETAIKPIREQLEGVTLALRTVSESVQQLSQGHQSISGEIQKLAASRTEPQDDPNIDLETMDRSQYADHITGKVLKAVEGMLGKLDEKIGGLHEGLNRSNVSSEVTRLSTTHKDFLDFRGEIAQEVKGNPSLALEDAYLLARSRNPKKAAELDAKYNPSPKGGPVKRDGFYGFGPNGGSGGTSTRMKFKEASELAWTEVEAALEEASKASQH